MGNSYLKKILIYSILFFTPSICFAQFDSNKIDLIETTAKREFDKNILYKYLFSSDSTDIIAALLSISHSEDTSFVQDLTKLNFNKYGKWISFALGQIGNSFSSKEFLFDKLAQKDCNCSEFIFSALGKIGNQTDFAELINFYNEHPEIEGIEEAILQFRNRNLTDERSKEILINEFNNPKSSFERKKKILFTLARLGSNSLLNSELIKILSEINDNEMLQLVLMNFRVQKYFPDNSELIDKLYNKDDEVRIELIKALPYSKATNEVLKLFTLILSDTTMNENILIETLRAIQIQKWETDLLHNYGIAALLKQIIKNKEKTFIVTEAIRSYSHLYGTKDLSQDTLLIKNLSEINLIQLLAIESNDLQFSSLLNHYSKISAPKEKLNALEIILNLSNEFSGDKDFNNFIFNELQSEDPAAISIIADGVDSVFISNNSDMLLKIIQSQANKFKHSSDFIEAEISLINLAGKISDDYQRILVADLSDTQLYFLRKFLKKFNPAIGAINKSFDNLSKLLRNAFNYSGAIIKTNKGAIEIKFRPELAPITVGNFIFLAKNNFYDGIIFHRVVPGFVIQAGDPTGTGWGGPGYEIVSEFSDTEFIAGSLGVASAGKDTEGSQFFIMQGYYPHLNSRYTLFAEVISGLDVAMKISEDDQIISIEIMK
ncbi:MAG: peptidylprolyl isomerase [Ignavibacterium sp.]